MTNEEVLEIIKKENFKLYNWYRSHELRPNEICIEKKENSWIVYATDERASVVTNSTREFDEEEKALDNFIKKVRLEKILFKEL
jgi:hypothetical protein